MPLSTNPNATTAVWLSCDKDTPMPERQVFITKFITRDQRERHQSLMEEAGAATDPKEKLRLLWEAITLGIVGWKNINGDDGKPLAFTAENVFRVLNPGEWWELAWTYPTFVAPTPEDFRFFASPSVPQPA